MRKRDSRRLKGKANWPGEQKIDPIAGFRRSFNQLDRGFVPVLQTESRIHICVTVCLCSIEC